MRGDGSGRRFPHGRLLRWPDGWPRRLPEGWRHTTATVRAATLPALVALLKVRVSAAHRRRALAARAGVLVLIAGLLPAIALTFNGAGAAPGDSHITIDAHDLAS